MTRRSIFSQMGVLFFEARKLAAAPRREYDVRSFGAIGDGKTIASSGINRAIVAASQNGGGTVVIPAGCYLCYSIRLRSQIELSIQAGATIVAAWAKGGIGQYFDTAEDNSNQDYQDFGHSHWHNSLMWGENLHDVVIRGPGLVSGQGLSKGYGPGPIAEKIGVGNKAISLKECRNVSIQDLAILRGGHFAILATGCTNVTIDNLRIDTNRDGIDIDCCRNVHISNCSINSPLDDSVCLKASYALGEYRATQNVTIANCYVTAGFEIGTLLNGTFKRRTESDFHVGRIKIGTESSGDFRNIAISNCVFERCQGLAIESVDGAQIEDVVVSNITMREITSAPLFIRLGSRLRSPSGKSVGSVRRVLIQNVTCSDFDANYASCIAGIPGHKISDVQISNLMLRTSTSGSAGPERPVPENQSAYPEPNMFGPLPARALFVRHAEDMAVQDLTFDGTPSDSRPLLYFADVANTSITHLRPKHSSGPLIQCDNVKDVSIFQCASSADRTITTSSTAIY